ncbi:MAG: roadblock/LC7 domain-containing protein [Gemmatimonadetes bacterium]|nr:roadblock/LC7 domain-containing protein [Gemmatimonadota bacterium]
MRAGLRAALDSITRIRGVHGAVLVAADDGLIVAEALMEGVRGNAVAALAASLYQRFLRATEAAGVQRPEFLHLQASQGSLLVVPAPSGVLIVAVAAADINVGLARLEMIRAAEAFA